MQAAPARWSKVMETAWFFRLKLWTVPLSWLLAVVDALWKGTWPDPYRQYVKRIPPPHPYSIATVAWVVGLITLHALLMARVLQPATYRKSWRRALGAFAATLPFLAMAVLGAMHSPPVFATYILWCLAWAGAVLALVLWSALATAFSRPLRDHRPATHRRQSDDRSRLPAPVGVDPKPGD